jgi:hypothetical protein
VSLSGDGNTMAVSETYFSQQRGRVRVFRFDTGSGDWQPFGNGIVGATVMGETVSFCFFLKKLRRRTFTFTIKCRCLFFSVVIKRRRDFGSRRPERRRPEGTHANLPARRHRLAATWSRNWRRDRPARLLRGNFARTWTARRTLSFSTDMRRV